MLSISLATSSPAEPTPLVHCKERCKVWWEKGSRGMCSWREPFPLLSLRSVISQNLGSSRNTVAVGSAPRRVAIHLPLETAASSGEAGKASVRFSFHLTSLQALQFQSLPGSPFTFGNKSASCMGTKHSLEKKRTRILRERNQQWAQQVICGLLGRTQIAFLPHLHTAIEAKLQHLKPWHCHFSWDLELLQKAQETCTSGQKLEAVSTWGCSGGWLI